MTPLLGVTNADTTTRCHPITETTTRCHFLTFSQVTPSSGVTMKKPTDFTQWAIFDTNICFTCPKPAQYRLQAPRRDFACTFQS